MVIVRLGWLQSHGLCLDVVAEVVPGVDEGGCVLGTHFAPKVGQSSFI